MRDIFNTMPAIGNSKDEFVINPDDVTKFFALSIIAEAAFGKEMPLGISIIFY
jgi:hypothetical protein